MNFKEKKIAYDNLKGEQYFEADLSLLKAKSPTNEWCKKKIFHPSKAQLEILWILLDLVTIGDIVTNRREVLKKKEIARYDAIVEECAKLVVQLEKSKSQEEADAFLITIDDKTLQLPGEVRKTILAHVESIALKTQKTAEGTGEKMKGMQAELGKENVLEVTSDVSSPEAEKNEQAIKEELPEVPAGDLVKELESENEELKSDLESKDEEVSDLEYEKEQLEEENVELQEQVEKLEKNLTEEKKSQPVTKVPVKYKKKKSTRKSHGKTSKK